MAEVKPAAPGDRAARRHWGDTLKVWANKASGATIVRLHRLAVRLDVTPDGFGEDTAVDENDPAALVDEWRRRLRSWAAYNPEAVLALKAGAVMLGLALVGLWLGARAVS